MVLICADGNNKGQTIWRIERELWFLPNTFTPNKNQIFVGHEKSVIVLQILQFQIIVFFTSFVPRYFFSNKIWLQNLCLHLHLHSTMIHQNSDDYREEKIVWWLPVHVGAAQTDIKKNKNKIKMKKFNYKYCTIKM